MDKKDVLPEITQKDKSANKKSSVEKVLQDINLLQLLSLLPFKNSNRPLEDHKTWRGIKCSFKLWALRYKQCTL